MVPHWPGLVADNNELWPAYRGSLHNNNGGRWGVDSFQSHKPPRIGFVLENDVIMLGGYSMHESRLLWKLTYLVYGILLIKYYYLNHILIKCIRCFCLFQSNEIKFFCTDHQVCVRDIWMHLKVLLQWNSTSVYTSCTYSTYHLELALGTFLCHFIGACLVCHTY